MYWLKVAAAYGLGDVVRLSYDGYRRGLREVPAKGSAAVAVTKTGLARLFTSMVMDGHSGHIDQFLPNLLFSSEHGAENARLIGQTSRYKWHLLGAYHGHIYGVPQEGNLQGVPLVAAESYMGRIAERPADDSLIPVARALPADWHRPRAQGG